MPLPPVEAVEPVPIPEALENRFVGPLLQMEIDGAIIASGPLPGLDGGPADRTKTHFGQQHGFARSLVDGLVLVRNGPSPRRQRGEIGRFLLQSKGEEGVDADVVELIPEFHNIVVSPPIGGIREGARIDLSDVGDQSPPVIGTIGHRARQFYTDAQNLRFGLGGDLRIVKEEAFIVRGPLLPFPFGVEADRAAPIATILFTQPDVRGFSITLRPSC